MVQRGVGDDPVLGLERVVVDAQDDRRVELVLGRGATGSPARRRRRCASGAPALLVKKPVDSSATWHLSSFQGRLAGSFSVVIRISLPLTTRRLLAGLDRALEPAVDAVVLQEQGQVLGVREVVDRDDLELGGCCASTRKTSRPIRPNPLIPTRTAMTGLLVHSANTRVTVKRIRSPFRVHGRRHGPRRRAAPAWPPINVDRSLDLSVRKVSSLSLNLAADPQNQTAFPAASQGFGAAVRVSQFPSGGLKLLPWPAIRPDSGGQESRISR